jgi:hypothetical protein
VQHVGDREDADKLVNDPKKSFRIVAILPTYTSQSPECSDMVRVNLSPGDFAEEATTRWCCRNAQKWQYLLLDELKAELVISENGNDDFPLLVGE